MKKKFLKALGITSTGLIIGMEASTLLTYFHRADVISNWLYLEAGAIAISTAYISHDWYKLLEDKFYTEPEEEEK